MDEQGGNFRPCPCRGIMDEQGGNFCPCPCRSIMGEKNEKPGFLPGRVGKCCGAAVSLTAK